jgi:TusA-related sulfurtransferase
MMLAFLLFCGLLAAQDMDSCPMHEDIKTQHQSDVEKHGDEAMGFPHEKTTHHFRLLPDGGAIEVTVTDAKDAKNIQAIRSHLTHIVTMFSNGDFSIPMFVHSKVPPGTTEMKKRWSGIFYTLEQLPTGARVRIVTKNRDALNAVHDFLNFQIEDHHTGDKD